MNVQAILDNAPLFAQGTLTTLTLLAGSLALGATLALPLAVLRSLPSPWAWAPVRAFTYVIRGTPLLVQLFLLYYGAAQFEAVRQSPAWWVLASATGCAMLALAINTCAYSTELLHGAIRSLPPGELEAARALGMSRGTLIRRIVLPQALRRSIPAGSNEVVMLLHGTSLASVVTLVDITGAARDMNGRLYLPFESFLFAGVLYAIISTLIVRLFDRAERHWLQPLVRRH